MTMRVPDGITFLQYLRGGHRDDDHRRARGERVVFIPWDAEEGTEFFEKTTQWNQRSGKQYRIVQYDPGAGESPFLLAINASPDAVVYIRGHGSEGAPYIQTRGVGGDPEAVLNLPITTACQRLIESGLQPSFPGVIKFYSCYSGTKLAPLDLAQGRDAAAATNARFQRALAERMITPEQYQRWRTDPPLDRSLAGQGADFLRAQGFTSCIFYGYLGPLAAEYEQDAGTREWHRNVKLTGLTNRPWRLEGLERVRPSVGRIRV